MKSRIKHYQVLKLRGNFYNTYALWCLIMGLEETLEITIYNYPGPQMNK